MFNTDDFNSALTVAFILLVVIYTLCFFGLGFFVGYYIH